MTHLQNILRVFLGFVFILSSILKIISIDEFEVYVFSQNIFNFTLSSFFSRILIGYELFLGIMLIINLYPIFIKKISILTLLLFTIFLSILSIKGSDENCHCFGEYFQLNSFESIIKNSILIILLLLMSKSNEIINKYKFLFFSSLITISLIIPMLISPPDFIYSNYYYNTEIDEQSLKKEILDNNNINIEFVNNKKIICFYSPKCRFCKLSERKISSIIANNKLNANYFCNIFWGNSKKIDEFYNSNSSKIKTKFIDSAIFLKITKGKMPLIVLIENKKVIKTFGYRSINENLITNFLK